MIIEDESYSDSTDVIDISRIADCHFNGNPYFRVEVAISSWKVVVRYVFLEEIEFSLGITAPLRVEHPTRTYKFSDESATRALEKVFDGEEPSSLSLSLKGEETVVRFSSISRKGIPVEAVAFPSPDKRTQVREWEKNAFVGLVYTYSPPKQETLVAARFLPNPQGLKALEGWGEASGLCTLLLVYDGDGNIFLAAPTGGSLMALPIMVSENIQGAPFSLNVPWKFLRLWREALPGANSFSLVEQDGELFLQVSLGRLLARCVVSENREVDPLVFESLISPESQTGSLRVGIATSAAMMSSDSCLSVTEAVLSEENLDYPLVEIPGGQASHPANYWGHIPPSWGEIESFVLPAWQLKRFFYALEEPTLLFGLRRDGEILVFLSKQTGIRFAIGQFVAAPGEGIIPGLQGYFVYDDDLVSPKRKTVVNGIIYPKAFVDQIPLHETDTGGWWTQRSKFVENWLTEISKQKNLFQFDPMYLD